MKDFKNIFLFAALLSIVISLQLSMKVIAQEADKTDSLYAARLMEDNLDCMAEVDSLNLVIKGY